MVDIDRASVALFVSRIAGRVIGFLSVAYFAWTLGATGLGIYFTFQTVVSVTTVFAEFGVPNAVVKRMNQTTDERQRGRYLTGGFVISGASVGLMSAAIVALGPRLVAYVELAPVVPLTVLGMALATSNKLLIGGLRGEERVATTAIVEFLGQVVRVAVSVGLLLAGLDVVALVYGYAIGVAAQTGVAYLLLDTAFALELPTVSTLRSLFGFSKYTIGMNVSNLAYNWTDTLVLAAFATKSAVGIYEASWKLSSVTLLAAQVVGIALAPTMTRWHEDGAIERIESAFSTAVTFALVLVVPALVGAAILGEEVLAVLFGFDAGAGVLVVLLVGQLSQAVKNVTQNTLFGIDRPEHVFWTNMASLLANLGLNVALVPRYGMFGAAAATAVTAAVTAVSQVGYLHRYLALGVDRAPLAWVVGSAATMGLVVTALSRITPASRPVGLFALVGVGALLYGAGLLTNRTIRGRLLNTELW
jgi:O-antigen/teichoic acid export membrane protein